MLRLFSLTVVMVSLLGQPLRGRAEDSTADIRLTLPPVGYAVAGAEMSVYFDNIVLTQHPEKLRFVVESRLGVTEAGRWTVTPAATDVGDHAWLGAHVVVTDGVRIGRDAIIGAGAIVRENVPDFHVAAGVPAKIIKDRRRGDSAAD